MSLTRRSMLQLGLAGGASIGVTTIMPFAAQAQTKEGDRYDAEGGEIVVFPISHASFAMTVPGMVIYNDPVGGARAYEGLPAPDLILVTHEHGDHYDANRLAALAGDSTKLVVNPAVFGLLPDALKTKATSIGNGESTSVGDVRIDAIPAYNTTDGRRQYHPQGRDNGYVLTVAGRRIYIAGDTEDIPEMRALTGIHIAFLPMNLPYTMDIDQAASAVAEFKPDYVYPYHYAGSNLKAFEAKVAEAGVGTRVVLGKWY
jgi:L-ascorbate metabolism protein UlaG (beta-lactamase superfamily)